MRYLLSQSLRRSTSVLLSLSLCIGVSMASEPETAVRQRNLTNQTQVEKQVVVQEQIVTQTQAPQQRHATLRRVSTVLKAGCITADILALLIVGYEIYKTYNLTSNDFQFEYKRDCLDGLECARYKGTIQSPILGFELSVTGYPYCEQKNIILPQSAIIDDLRNRVASLLMNNLSNKIVLMDLQLIGIMLCFFQITLMLG